VVRAVGRAGSWSKDGDIYQRDEGLLAIISIYHRAMVRPYATAAELGTKIETMQNIGLLIYCAIA
jgi:hypothetical protein